MALKLSNNAIQDLRSKLQLQFGEAIESSLSDQEVNDIGSLLLNILAESLKLESTNTYQAQT